MEEKENPKEETFETLEIEKEGEKQKNKAKFSKKIRLSIYLTLILAVVIFLIVFRFSESSKSGWFGSSDSESKFEEVEKGEGITEKMAHQFKDSIISSEKIFKGDYYKIAKHIMEEIEESNGGHWGVEVTEIGKGDSYFRFHASYLFRARYNNLFFQIWKSS